MATRYPETPPPSWWREVTDTTGLATSLKPGEALVYLPGSSMATYQDRASSGVYVIPGAELAERFPGSPVVELEEWPAGAAWPGPATSTIVQGPSGDPALIGVNLERVLFGHKEPPSSAIWVVAAVAGVGLLWWLSKRRG